jgi:hypothetical protein
VSPSTREPRKLDFHLINPAATPFEGEQRPGWAILPKKQTLATGRLVKYAGGAAAVSAAAPRPPAGIADRNGMSRPAASVSGNGGMSGTEQVPGRAASRGSLPGKMLVFQRRAVMPHVRMASFWHELLNSSHDPVCKTGRDRCSTPWNPAFHTRTGAGISDAFGSSTLKAFRLVHSSKLHHLFSRLSELPDNDTDNDRQGACTDSLSPGSTPENKKWRTINSIRI